jgi:hypothetical protein
MESNLKKAEVSRSSSSVKKPRSECSVLPLCEKHPVEETVDNDKSRLGFPREGLEGRCWCGPAWREERPEAELGAELKRSLPARHGRGA